MRDREFLKSPSEIAAKVEVEGLRVPERDFAMVQAGMVHAIEQFIDWTSDDGWLDVGWMRRRLFEIATRPYEGPKEGEEE